MAIEKQQEINESQIGLTLFSKQRRNMTDNDKLCFVDSPPSFNSSGSPPSTDAIIIIDDDEEVTLERPKKKKRRLGSWWDNVEPFDELMCVVKGAPKAKEDNDVTSRADSCFSSTDLNETETEKKNDDDDEISHPKKKKNEESVGESTTTRNKKDYDHVTLEDLEVSMEDLKSIPWESFDTTWEIRSDPWLGGYLEDFVSL
ncbi:PREDICTED: uncharacterized protein LOC104704858 [Camelina sativa]|uniref:Uncharacterized protein LOC104704858 n=1 Tax=Camelina sativa TaxID=90675 RepID=A0ABM0T0Z9_CAMSA|nr:PREDICTED: uncharacterized protein LOC104704858 [Camelina sativa]